MTDIDPTAPLRADNNPKFYARFKWLGLGAIAFGLYCLYDGYVRWPDQAVRGQALVELAQERISQEELLKITAKDHGVHERYTTIREHVLENEEHKAAWVELASENEWPSDPPGKYRDQNDIIMQYLMAIPCAIAAVWMLLTVYFSNGRWIELREGAIHTSWGQTFPLESITEINKRQWRDKGIARVKYEHDGRSGKFVVDDYKFHRKNTDQILLLIEQAVGTDKITGGPPEKTSDDTPVIDDETVHHKADQTVLDTQS